jgi:RND family efflux transporter MFP subunit
MNRLHLSKGLSSRAARRGVSWAGMTGVLSGIVAIPLLAWYVIPDGTWTAQEDGPLTEKVKRAAFVHELLERGDVESSSTVDVRCEVRNTSGTQLIEIVPEGTRVKEGEIICKLDSSALENELNAQQQVVNGSEAALIGAEAALETAEIAKQEYLEGIYKNEESLIQGEIFQAKEDLRRAEQYVKYSETLAARNFVTSVTLEADRFAVEKAKKVLATAETKLKVLQNYTKAKMLNQLDAAIETAKANLKAQEAIHRINLENLQKIQDQIDKCTVRAPQEGEVTYANSSDMRDSDAIIIKEGVMIRERQPIVRLPDPNRMQVNAKVNEAKINKIKIGMPATIKIEALAGQELQGTVAKVFPYANRSRWSASTIREFSVIVEIKNPPPELRTGSSAEVRIRVAQSPSELLVPVQAVLENNGKYYCVWKNPDGLVAKEVEIGATNDTHVVIRSGVTEEDQVVMNPRAYLDQLGLPAAIDIQPEIMLASQEPAPGGAQSAAGNASTEPAGASRGPGGGGMLQNFDRNGDGRLSQDEVPPQMASRFATGDKNGDGFLDADEISALPRRGPGGGRPGGPVRDGAFGGGSGE